MMVELEKDKKSPVYIITKKDSEGFHRQLHITIDEMKELLKLFTRVMESERI